MQFASDNWAGAHPRIIEAIAAEAARHGAAYGESEIDRRIADRFGAVFEHDVSVFLVGTGTAANSLSLAAAGSPGGIAYCHRDSHVARDECGAVPHQADGLRLEALAGPLAKFAAADLAREIAEFPADHVHAGRLSAVSVTQGTEAGTAYTIGELSAISEIVHGAGLKLHMDGARFANALVHLDTSPAAMTVECGVDILSFGATKNGCLNAEAIIAFDPELARDLPYLRMRAGHLFSKSRFIAVQLEAYLADGLWLELAGHANTMAERLRAAIASSPRARLAWPSQINEVFAILDWHDAARLMAAGATFHEWSDAKDGEADEKVYRLVTSYATEPDEIDRLADILASDAPVPA